MASGDGVRMPPLGVTTPPGAGLILFDPPLGSLGVPALAVVESPPALEAGDALSQPLSAKTVHKSAGMILAMGYPYLGFTKPLSTKTAVTTTGTLGWPNVRFDKQPIAPGVRGDTVHPWQRTKP